MGVYGLQTFIENSIEKKNVEIVSLKKEAKRYRKRYNTIPILAIDGMNIIPDVYNNEKSILGGQWREFVMCIKKFVKQLEIMHINPVFFFDKPQRESHKIHWEDKRRRELNNVKSVVSKLTEDVDPDYALPLLPPEWGIYARFVVKYECCCDIRTLQDDADMTIAKFANNTEECFGILANDTDYLIFDTKPLYLMRKLDVNSMTTEVWRRENIAKILEIELTCLPLFSCMLGNSVIPFHMLNNFHAKLARKFGTERYRIVNVLKYFHRYVRMPVHLDDLAIAIELPETLLREGLDSYNLNSKTKHAEGREWCDELLFWLRQRRYKCDLPSAVYNLLNEKIYKSRPVMQDPNMISAALLYRKMRQRMYSLIFGDQERNVRELCAYRNSDLKTPCLVSAIRINIQDAVPTLKELFSDQVELETRWKLFLSCMGINIPLSKLENMKPALVTICCILNFLLQCKELQLRDYEVKAFICQAIFPCCDNLLYLDELKVKKTIPRAVSLAGVFISGVSNLINVLVVCGLPYPLQEAMPWKYFDGKLFHHCYSLLEEDITPEDVYRLKRTKELYKELYKITTIGTYLHEK